MCLKVSKSTIPFNSLHILQALRSQRKKQVWTSQYITYPFCKSVWYDVCFCYQKNLKLVDFLPVNDINEKYPQLIGDISPQIYFGRALIT